MSKAQIKKILKKRLKDIFEGEIEVLPSSKEKFGDYCTNLPLVLAKDAQKNPIDLAQEMAKVVQGERIFEKVEVSKPGFINFFLSKGYLKESLARILKEKESFGKVDFGKKKLVNLEFISANPTGPLHVGNGRAAFFGDCLARVLEFAGYRVFKEYFINDAKHNSQIKELGRTALGRGKSYLNEYLTKKIEKNKKILDKMEDESEAGFFLAKEIQKDIQDFIERKLKIHFHSFVAEQELFEKSKVQKIYLWLKKQNLIYEKEGAFWIKISNFGAPKDEVLIRKDKTPTYFLSDIAYHKDKIDRGFKKIIDIWGADHQGHVKRMEAIMKILGFEGEFEILISQIVTLKGGEKLSKRKGKIILLEELVDEIGLDATRFFYLTRSLDKPLEFDFELAKEKSQRNPLFYTQYAFARICSLERKWGKKIKATKRILDLISHPLEFELIKQLIQLPDLVEEVAKNYQIQLLPNYAQKLAQSFHHFYEQCQIISSDSNLTNARMALALATKIVLKKVFDLMGVFAPEKM